MRSLNLGFVLFVLAYGFETTALAQAPVPASGASDSSPSTSTSVEPSSAVSTPENSANRGRFVIGARSGYGVAMGDAEEDGTLSDAIKGQIPIWIDLGYLVTPSLMVGLYGHYGFGINGSPLRNFCDTEGLECSTSDIRLGAQAQYHPLPDENIDPWFGIGFGYEWLRAKTSRNVQGVNTNTTATYRGFEFFNLQGGVDFKLSRAFNIGPFLSFSLGEYGNFSASITGRADASSSVDNKALHEWLTFGVRGAFTL